MTSGPDPQRIILLLRAQVRLRRLALASPPDAKCSRGSRAMSAVQTILFTRYADVLRPYKYSGYPMLIKTIQLETHDDMLFSRYDSTAANVRRLLCADVRACTAERRRWAAGMHEDRAHPLLPAASELAYHTVNVSALNAEGLC